MSDRGVTGVALLCWAIALGVLQFGWQMTPVLAISASFGAGALFVLHRRRAAVAVLLALGSGIAATRAVPPPVMPQRHDVTVVVATDPVERNRVARAETDIDDHRVRLVGFGRTARRLARLPAGTSIAVSGRWRPLPPARWWGAIRSEFEVESFEDLGPSSRLIRAADRVRRHLADGANRLEGDRQALYLGIAYGDDRALSPEAQVAMRQSGLSHLTAVSGQNLAVLLTVVRPMLRRRSRRLRAAVVSVVAVWLVVLTRFEPSILRAAYLAGALAVGDVLARPVSGRRALALAVLVGLFFDPFLAVSAGFQLSAAATAGIVWWSPVIARWLGDATGEAGGWRGAVAATVSAQLATAPLLARFGGTLTVASLPANLVAVPAAGATMVWSWTFGLVAAIWPPLGAVNSFVVGLATGFVLNVGQGAAAHPIATIPWFLAWSVAAAVAIVMWRRPNVVSPISPPSGPAQAPS